MSLAMKYQMKKRMAKGGMAKCPGSECMGCSSPQCYADGGPVEEPKGPPVDPEKAKKAEESMRKAFGYAEGGETKTSTTGNKTKTGGSNPGGASTGGAGTVTITTGKNPPGSISISDVGGRTDAHNAGGMDPDEDDDMMMANGGMVHAKDEYDRAVIPPPLRNKAASAEDLYMDDAMAEGKDTEQYSDDTKRYYDGGLVSEEDASGYPPDLVSRIMKERCYSKGGRVANDTDMYADTRPNEFDDLVLRDNLEFHYTGANSGDEIGDAQEDEDRRDIISRIMRSRAKKDRMPRPA